MKNSFIFFILLLLFKMSSAITGDIVKQKEENENDLSFSGGKVGAPALNKRFSNIPVLFEDILESAKEFKESHNIILVTGINDVLITPFGTLMNEKIPMYLENITKEGVSFLPISGGESDQATLLATASLLKKNGINLNVLHHNVKAEGDLKPLKTFLQNSSRILQKDSKILDDLVTEIMESYEDCPAYNLKSSYGYGIIARGGVPFNHANNFLDLLSFTNSLENFSFHKEEEIYALKARKRTLINQSIKTFKKPLYVFFLGKQEEDIKSFENYCKNIKIELSTFLIS